MATKTFKIGLSATDKQNMAQDVYERVLALTFEEYDSSETYNTGDFVVYNDALYQCKEDNVTGTWNSAKWQAATLQDLLDDVEGAVASVSGKANIIDLQNGTLVVAKAQVAEQIANVGEDVGSTQEEPFIFQATATNNGLDSVETAPIAKHLLKQGNSVVVNQLVQNGNFETTTTWGATRGTIAATDNICTYTITEVGNGGDANRIDTALGKAIPAGRTIYFEFSFYAAHAGSGEVNIFNSTYYPTFTSVVSYSAGWNTLRFVRQLSSSYGDSVYLRIGFNATNGGYSVGETVKWKNIMVIDLTQWGFTADEITDLTAHPEHFFNYYNGSLAYNVGTLTNCNGRYLKCIGRNQFNKATVVNGKYIGSDGSVNSDARFAHSDFIRVTPDTIYYVTDTSLLTYIGMFYCYDKDKNWIGGISAYNSEPHLRKTLANAAYIRVNMMASKIDEEVISIWYSDGTDYDQYFPYEENVYDTGAETLLSAVSVRDYKTPDGVIHRLVGSVDLGTLTWTYYSGTQTMGATITGIASGTNPKALCAKYARIIMSGGWADLTEKTFGITGGEIRIKDTSSGTDAAAFKTAMSGVYLYYELATPTTEDGTSFPENVIVDNYGSMGWLDTSENFVATPQGSQFFYPADYVEFLDSLYTRSKDGGDSADVTNIVVKSELTPFANQDTILQNAIGGTLRQCLCVKENLDFDNTDVVDLGSLSWSFNSTYQYFGASISNIAQKSSGNQCKVLDTYGYKQKGYGSIALLTSNLDLIIGANETLVYIKNTAYTDADTFKAAMKGVLLAYEKA